MEKTEDDGINEFELTPIQKRILGWGLVLFLMGLMLLAFSLAVWGSAQLIGVDVL